MMLLGQERGQGASFYRGEATAHNMPGHAGHCCSQQAKSLLMHITAHVLLRMKTDMCSS